MGEKEIEKKRGIHVSQTRPLKWDGWMDGQMETTKLSLRKSNWYLRVKLLGERDIAQA